MDIHAYQIFNFDQLELSFSGHLNVRPPLLTLPFRSKLP